MTAEEFQQRIAGIVSEDSDLEVYVSPDFQCEQTGGFPTSLCVCWEQGKAWLQPNEFMQAPGEDITRVWQGCADFGFRACADVETHNALLKQLGEDAYQMAYLPEEPGETDNEGMEMIL